MGNLWGAFWEGFMLGVAGIISAIVLNAGPGLAIVGMVVVVFLHGWLTRRQVGRRIDRS